MDLSDLVKAFVSVLVTINPIGAIPFYISLTARHSVADRVKIIKTTALAVAIILVVTACIGEYIIALFGISIGSFEMGGGILVLLLAISMMNARIPSDKQTQEEREEAFSKENVAVVPLALPLLAGPGAISSMIIATNKTTVWYENLLLGLVGIMVAIVIWGALKLAAPISRLLGKTGINIATRIMGLLLAAIAVEFMIDGLKSLLPVLQ